jgi:murein DD-endopeptidase MepM/ murein hydrolase activator NlpD
MASKGTPTAAVVDGVITRMNNSTLGGISLYLRGGDGTEYFYTHLNGYANISQGSQVGAGTIIAYVGSTGNASESSPHLHFEMHPGGGAAVDPYRTVKAACG